MVIMISPAKTEQVLASFLDLSCPISFFPIAAFFREEKFTGNILPDQLDSFGLQLKSEFNSIRITRKIPLSSSPQLLRSDNRGSKYGKWFARNEVSPTQSIDREKLNPIIDCDHRTAQPAPESIAYFGRQIVGSNKIDQRFHSNYEAGWHTISAAIRHHRHPRQHGLRMKPDFNPCWRLHLLRKKSHLPQLENLLLAYGQVIDPFKP